MDKNKLKEEKAIAKEKRLEKQAAIKAANMPESGDFCFSLCQMCFSKDNKNNCPLYPSNPKACKYNED